MAPNWCIWQHCWGIVSRKDQNLRLTQETYEQIAAVYAQRNRDRSVLDRDIAQFVSLVKPGGWVVDVGCGPGFDSAVFQQNHLKTIAFDYTYAMMQAGQSELDIEANFVQGDMRYLPFAAQIDGLWVSASLLHLNRADVPYALRQFYRILQNGGVMYLAVKLGEGEEWTAVSYDQNAPRYFTYWQEDELDALLKDAGFTLVDGWLSKGRATWIVRFARR